MKRIAESHQGSFFDAEASGEYLNDAKKASKTKYRHFMATLKKLDVKGKYLEIGSGVGILTQDIAIQHPNAEIMAYDILSEMTELSRQDLSEDLRKRISYETGDACDENSIKDLGGFNLIYSAFTLHHWDNAELAIKNLYSLLNDEGILYIYDLKRVMWLYYIKSESGFFNSIRAAYRLSEIKKILSKIGIKNYRIRTILPFFIQSVLIRK
ncbi:MAG: class I SAM-dependent methyltransferase [Candidatus Cloacimonetes bacterium]|nr:class I SAM-dependent methyltransferase [Candidatus Cloacimonadota bacterium]